MFSKTSQNFRKAFVKLATGLPGRAMEFAYIPAAWGCGRFEESLGGVALAARMVLPFAQRTNLTAKRDDTKTRIDSFEILLLP